MLRHIKCNAKSTITDIDDKCIQPNAIDLRIDSIVRIDSTPFVLSEEIRTHRKRIPVLTRDDWYILPEGSYDVMTTHTVEIAEGEAGIAIPRSSLSRNGCVIAGGLYDSGFKGRIGFCLHINSGYAEIKKGTRLAQFLIMDADTFHLYKGSYGVGENGLNPEEAKLYS